MELPINQIINGDCLQILKTLPDESIDMIMTSPPYWALRSYGSETETIWDGDENCGHEWKLEVTKRPNSSGGRGELSKIQLGNIGSKFGDYNKRETESNFCSKCKAWKGQLGLEPTFDLYIKHLCNVFDEVKRVLKKEGTCFVNIGDTYYGSGAGAQKNNLEPSGKQVYVLPYENVRTKEWQRPSRIESYKAVSNKKCLVCDKDFKGRLNKNFCSIECLNSVGNDFRSINRQIPDKCLCLIPFRFVIEMVNRKWILRNTIIWHKPNCMPSSIKDRFTVDFEYLFFFVKNKKYYFNTQYEPVLKESIERSERAWIGTKYNTSDLAKESGMQVIEPMEKMGERFVNPLGRNKRCVWTIPTQPFSEPHFACVSEDTECLTIDGWKRYNEIKRGNLIASYDIQNKKIKWTPLTYLKTYNISEKLIHIGNRDLDILMTPNHRNVVLNNKEEKIVLAENLSYGDKIKVSSDFEIDEHNSIGRKIAELIGWIIAEGHYQKGGGIYIYQNEGRNADRIRLLLNPFSYKESIRRNNQIQWYIPKLTSLMLKSICPNKKLSKDLVLLPIQECKCLFEGLIRGDGHTRKDDGRIMFIQKDKETIDWFSILAMRLGYHPIISKRKNENYCVYLTKKEYIGIRKTNGKGKNLEYIDYKGIVWCPKTKYGTWVARRNGRIFITGNTYPKELCYTPIKAGCPEFVCTKCGKAKQNKDVHVGIYDENIYGELEINKDKPYSVVEREGGVAVRDLPELNQIKEYLNFWKNERNLTIEEIENLMDSQSPHHWFSGESYPTKEDWIKIKEILKFDDKFDEQMLNEKYKSAKKLETIYKKKIILCSCNEPFESGIILDPFMGSGVTGLSALKLNRRFIGIELNPSYCKIAYNRLLPYLQQRKINEFENVII